ncbi:hypothetical protein BY458DRAFT_525850 [Sporodiniella umbellata]|nr:hypothetical protein BY458DRAFT_525850 [Sporodiniella umbellata]
MYEQTKKAKERTDPPQRRSTIVRNEPRHRSQPISREKKPAVQDMAQFPPRSRFLKQLAAHQTASRPRPLDPSTLKEYFSKKQDKDQVVNDWMSEVERHGRPSIVSLSPSLSGFPKIQFKSETGKRWAHVQNNTSLQPPAETCQKHHVPRSLLTNRKRPVTEIVDRIEAAWHDPHSQQTNEIKVGSIAMAYTGQKTPMAGMLQLVQMLHHQLKIHQQKVTDLSLLQKKSKKDLLLAAADKKNSANKQTKSYR